MEYDGTYGKGCFILSFNSKKLYWHLASQHCSLYFMKENGKAYKRIDLPYLPYDISFNKLKLYLTLR
jgi:hypothetical protein